MGVKPDSLPHHCSAGGTGAVCDGNTSITYNRNGSIIKRTAPHASSVNGHEVYLSITNPAETTAPLQRAYVECKGNNGGAVTAVHVHFANCVAFSKEIKDGDEDFNIWGDGSVFDKAYGINVTLVVNLPAQESSLELYSVTLGFGHAIPRDGIKISPGFTGRKIYFSAPLTDD
ncbi:uncharacterized protein TRIVIDRAFT_216485 [Trichoderma virens Gv29-8]|uniref:Uncharacterized protein n=1 Tax=Hypocrea virens (strain Gv29-8 / FGSC 10586) TaxID=413071 RepID=G9N0R8_HYPVG|nr:uncharacterized protein TRIVIDRAFT_216485 [Trichoderma virens Gv29-8]EHK19950.1 hypothetical protein TRIVIDRAFT_216485 [Trichoderma virens Gv29-8]